MVPLVARRAESWSCMHRRTKKEMSPSRSSARLNRTITSGGCWCSLHGTCLMCANDSTASIGRSSHVSQPVVVNCNEPGLSPVFTDLLGASLAIYGGVSPSRVLPGVARWSDQSGRAWPSMYCLMIDRGAPPQETAK